MTITRIRRRLGRWLLGEPAPVPGPVYVAGLPCAVTLDVDVLIRANVADLLDLLADEFADDLAEYADQTPRPAADRFAPETLAVEELVDRLVDRLSTRVALTPQQALRVSEQVRVLAVERMPRVAAQRAAEGGAAA
ncbi:hypothetical protein [Streptomyces sp. MK37H]|uniref:hypothetical protein n=1 Tax=Streptomyces sp. MK37H TaxID=2699117 RepID=UPI001B3777F6|nr:hypothetical protein [Streptomyces sp. MK37H]MBP8536123.1 hypothetical protein [Streptomyces sp. MK37H]